MESYTPEYIQEYNGKQNVKENNKWKIASFSGSKRFSEIKMRIEAQP